MLRIIQNRAADSAKSYYSHSDYLSEGQEHIGVWGGKAAELLGVCGEVSKIEFDRLCDNLDPKTGNQLTARTRFDRTVGYDFNFHAPKGVSVAFALYQDERIREAFDASVDETMAEAEQDARARVRRDGVNAERTTGNLVWAGFTHLTARPVDGVPDMHLHKHCFTFNVTWDDVDGSYKAAQFREIKRDAPYFEAAFHARFARRLAELGYVIERKGRTWDIAEVPQSVRDKFSRRTGQIEEFAASEGIVDAAAKDKLAARTREGKQTQLSMGKLRAIWWARLSDEERNALAVLADRMRPVERITAREGGEAKALAQAELHCFERQSVVPARTLLAEALRRGLGQVTVDGMRDALGRSRIVVRDFRGQKLATTQEVLAEESAMINFARDGRGGAEPLNEGWTIRQDFLNGEQREAVSHLLAGRDRVMLLRGGAGTGKTSLMQEAVEGIEAGGHQVLAFAPSAEASRGVLQSEGFAGATTVAELLVNPELQAAAKGQVIWIDEAGLLGSKTLKQVFDLANQIDARVILSGDWKQHGSVERGAALRLLERYAGLKPAEISAIQRQRDQYREAVAAIAGGDLRLSIELLDRLGWVKQLADADRPAAVARDYADSVMSGQSTLVISPTHREGDQITQAIRHELRQREKLRGDECTVLQLKPLHLTEAERRDAAFYMPGDVVAFQKNAPGHTKGERVIVSEQVSDELLALASAFAVFRRAELALAAGDQLRITSNGKTLDGKHRLNNGATYKVAGFTDRGDVKLSNGWIVARDFGHVAHGYVTTSHAAQGKTVDHVILAESAMSYPAASAEQFYVSASRGRKKCSIYCDDIESLEDAVAGSSAKLSATELASANEQRRRQRHRAKYAAAMQSQSIDHTGVPAYGR